MDQLSALLRQARQEKQLSLKDISEVTKIQTHYLEALENGDFTVFAGEVYLKGALQNFAVTVGLNSEEVLALYNKLRHEVMEAGEAEQPAVRRVKAVAKPRKKRVQVAHQGPSLTAGVVVLVLVLAVTAIWYGVNSSREEPAGQPEPPGNSMLPDGGNNVQDGEPELETPLPPAVELISASGRETIYSVSGTEEIQVKLTLENSAGCS